MRAILSHVIYYRHSKELLIRLRQTTLIIMKPYIGITDFTCQQEVDAILVLERRWTQTYSEHLILETRMRCSSIAIAVGGLGPDTMDVVLPLVAEFPDISIDAQGKLRKSGNALDPIHWDLAAGYLCEAGKIFN
jgi:hypothetical protein